MKTKLLVAFIILNVMFTFAQTESINNPVSKRVRIENPTDSNISQILSSGIDLRCGAIHNHDELILELNKRELDALQKQGVKYEILIEDLTKFYSERAIRDLPKAKALLKAEKARNKSKNKSTTSSKISNSISSTVIDSYLQYYGENEVDWATPTNFNIPSTFGGCLTVSGMEAQLDAMRAAYPNLITVKTDASPSNQKTYGFTGSGSWAGQTVYYVKISDNPDTDDSNEPDILYTSMIHSRELSALMGNIYFMWYLLENYSTDSAIKHLVDNNELYFVPIVNPDGLKWNEKYAPNGGGMNRTNLRGYPTATNNSSYQLNYGVDPNRNFDYLWGSAGDASGSNGDYRQSTYRGPTAFSEPESQIMRDFILARNFKSAVWQHSYANAIPHPYGGIPTKVSNREDEMARWHQDMSRYNRYISGAQVLTPANGIADDWMLGGTIDGNGSSGSGMNILATTPENGADDQSEGGFWPAPSQIVPIAKRMVRINLMNAYYGGKYAKLHDLTQSDISTLTSNLTFAIERVGQTASDFTITVTPISTNISSVGAAVTKSGMNALDQENVSIQIVLDSGIAANDKIEYKVSLSNEDGIIYEANFEKYYQPTVLFIDNPDVTGLTNWNSSGTWSAVTSGAWSGTSIKDGSGTPPYASSSTKTLTTSNSYDFSGSSRVLVQFYSKWDIERNYDFVELLGSPDGGTTWYNLNGKYNKPNASTFTNSAQNNSAFNPDKSSASKSFQANNSSGLVYDGDQMDNWVMEEIAIDASNNSELVNSTEAVFRFRFRSDANNRTENYSTTYDGFYFDDFKIIKITEPCVISTPTNVNSSAIEATTVTIGWDLIPSATYDLRYRQVGSGPWTEINDTSTTSEDLTGLTASTQYEYQVRSRCTSSTSSYSSLKTFTTTAISYCNYVGNTSFQTGISSVVFNTLNNTDGPTKDIGYEHFSNTTQVDLGETHTLTVNVNTDGNYTIHAYAYIDFNGDGNFIGNNVEVFDLGDATNGSNKTTSITPNITIPNNSILGSVRMRIAAKYNADPEIDGCNAATFDGEVEDYTINIIDSTLGIEDEILSTFQLYPNPVKGGDIKLKIPREISEFNVGISNVLGQKVYESQLNDNYKTSHTINTSNLRSGIYFVTVSTNLGKATKKLIIQD